MFILAYFYKINIVKVCRYCGTELSHEHENRGFCDDCYEIIMKDPTSFKTEILDNIDQPFFVLDKKTTRIVTANEKFLDFVSKTFDQVANQLGGDVIGCIHANRPGGCGKGEFCGKCPIRNLVQKTIDTGEPQNNAHIVQLIYHDLEKKKISLHMSTKIRNGYMFLQINDFEFID